MASPAPRPSPYHHHAVSTSTCDPGMNALPYTDPPELDHIVHLVPPGGLQDAVAQFRKLGFSVESGGVHADGLTQNALIVLTDGVYIELIEFLDKPLKEPSSKESLQQWKERRSKHWWWHRKSGWIDWCLRGGTKDGCVDAINSAGRQVQQSRKAETGKAEEERGSTDAAAAVPMDLVTYKAPQAGGRRALSGKEIQWNVSFPTEQAGTQRGTFPFWCEDTTPRWWRVPTPSPHHANLTKGLAALTLLYYPETFPSRTASLQLILASKQAAAQGGDLGHLMRTIVDTKPPPKTEGRSALPDAQVEFYLATPEGPLLPLRIKAAQDPDEVQWLEEYGEGLWEVEISVAPEKLPKTAPPDGIERESSKKGYGRLRLHPMRSQPIPLPV